MLRPHHFLAASIVALAVVTSGCYTKVGVQDPYGDLYGSGYEYSDYDYWTDGYYVMLPYSPWEPYPGTPWWYQDYHRCGPPRGYHPYVEDIDVARSRTDRGPGIPVSGSGGGVVGGGYAPSTPAPTDSSPQTEPSTERTGNQPAKVDRKRAGSDGGERKKSESSTTERRSR